MKATKLIKVENGFVLMVDNVMFATDNDKLSLKNCEAIANGYDLDELAESKYGTVIESVRGSKEYDIEADRKSGFKTGFQKALEILGDKKFSENDVIKFMQYIIANEDLGNTSSVSPATAKYYLDQFTQSLQQTQWDVEIVTKDTGLGARINREHKLDENGYLVLIKI